MSRTPQKKVTNIEASLESETVLLIVVTIFAGLCSWFDTERKRLLVTAMNRLAGTPLPLTSPMQKNSFSSLI